MEAIKCLNNFEIFFDKMFHFKTKIDGKLKQYYTHMSFDI